MKDPIQPTAKPTNPGTEDSFTKKQRVRAMKTQVIDGGDAGEFDTQDERIIDFMNRVEITRGHDDIIETTQNIINHFVPKGLGNALHFDYKGVKVCLVGTREALERKLEETIEEKMHGNLRA